VCRRAEEGGAGVVNYDTVVFEEEDGAAFEVWAGWLLVMS
jgi:hypothetical protein